MIPGINGAAVNRLRGGLGRIALHTRRNLLITFKFVEIRKISHYITKPYSYTKSPETTFRYLIQTPSTGKKQRSIRFRRQLRNFRQLAYWNIYQFVYHMLTDNSSCKSDNLSCKY